MSKVLIIENDKLLLELLQDIFTEEGYDTCVYTQVVAIETIVQMRPDVIILDLLLNATQQTSWPLLQELGCNWQTQSIPVVLCTLAYREVHAISDYLWDHDIPVVFKPFDIDNLLQVARQVQTLTISGQS